MSALPAPGDHLALEITGFAHGGYGIGRTEEGVVVFARGAAFGEIVRVRLDAQQKATGPRFATVTEVIDAHPGRVEHRCAAASRGGGCCNLDYLTDAAENDHKTLILADQLYRIGGLDHPVQVESFPPAAGGADDRQRGWRARTRLAIDAQGRAGVRRPGSHDIVTGVCQQLLPGLVKGVSDYPLTPGNEVLCALDAAGQRHIVEIRIDSPTPRRDRSAATRRRQRAPRSEIVAIHEGTGTATEAIGDFYIDTPATGFWQPHVYALDTYLSVTRQWLRRVEGLRGTDSVDLYGGVGAFATVAAEIAGPAGTAHVIEANPEAVAAGEEALAMLPLQYHCGGVAQQLRHLELANPLGAVIVDPPRKGAGAAVITALAARAPKVVVHVGCDPATFARDARGWVDAGYELRELRAFNAFPGTHHVETLGLFLPKS